MPKITKALVAALEPPESGDETTWDSAIAGFGVRVWAGGAKTYILKYRNRDGRVRKLTIGRVGTLTLDEARDEAAKALGAVARGEDPAADKQAHRRAETVEQVVELYALEGLFVQRGVRKGEPMKPLTAAYTISRLRHHVIPLLGKMKAKTVRAGDIERFVRDVTNGKSARDEKIKDAKGEEKRVIVRGGDGAARKVVRDLSAVFSFAKRRGIVDLNPVEGASVRKTDNKRERYLNLEEIQRLGAAFDALEASGSNSKALDICRLWALTGARRNEIAGLKWAEVDLETGFLRFEDSKTGKSLRPLGTAARVLLARLYSSRDKDKAWVFPAERGAEGFYSGTKRIWTLVKKKARLDDITPHTLRHSLGSVAASGGEALLIVGSLLGHANARSTQIYAHIDRDPSQRAADKVSSTIAAALAGNSGADVIRLQVNGK
ncbi:site-specific integrase [Rhizobium sp. 16-449-1b]|uniref:tyrosine-type recombinase/integrase n=1 Tax=Rhizobium sp. 16-449-1b TaxID=2819989 RepID=UPI001AD9786E|nr:site-specific integrase [Rhizobium sp. 16-449-1b]MBO9195697.1 site-specific integrase [Rhizobium sp. 16-449-1b]